MFRKLRLQLMLVNLSVILILFLLLITGTYLFVQDRMSEGREHMMNKMSHDLISGKLLNRPPEYNEFMDKPIPPPPDHNPGPIPLFVKINTSGTIIQTSQFISLTNKQLSSFVTQIQNAGQNNGTIIFEKTEFAYRLTPSVDAQDIFIIFQNLEHDHNLLQSLVMGLSFTGIVCMILSLFGSLFMANRAMIPIKKSWQQQKDFLADASHEFRTPLAVIQTNLEIVRDSPDETVKSQERWLSNIYEETLCMTKLVESLLFLARADSHQQLLTKDHFAINTAIFSTVELFNPLAKLAGVSITLHNNNPPIMYYADETKLKQVISILLDNALRHTPSGGKITINLENSEQGLLLSIIDTGEGISPNHLEKIFERFYQSDSSRSKGGAGLGLSIAKWIIKQHNGTITVVSTLGNGSTFNIFLPH